MKILLASRNPDKLREVQSKVNSLSIQILPVTRFHNLSEVEEDGDTLEANALKKALTLHQLVNIPTLADDTGLEVAALQGAPGVFSSRFAGPGATYADNVNKLLLDLQGIPWEKRQASFRCVLAYADQGKVLLFEGRTEGLISTQAQGTGGFGYDPIFYIPEERKTFAELTLDRKNEISH